MVAKGFGAGRGRSDPGNKGIVTTRANQDCA